MEKTTAKIESRNSCLSLLIFCFIYCGIAIYMCTAISIPAAETHAVWLPPDADIWPVNNVHPGIFKVAEKTRTILPLINRDIYIRPGTFKLIVPLEKLMAATSAYKTIAVHSECKNSAVMEYWKQREDGTYLYSSVETKLPDACLISWDTKFDEQAKAFIFTPKKDPVKLFAFIVLGLIMAFVSSLIKGVISINRKKQQKIQP